MSRRRLVVGSIVLVVLISGALNVAGVLRYPGGPLRESDANGPLWLDTRPADAGTDQVGITTQAGVGPDAVIYTGIALNNDSPWPATVEDVRLVGMTPGLRLIETRMALPGTSGDMPGAILGTAANVADLRLSTDYAALPATLAPDNDPNEGRILIEVAADQPGELGYDGVAVDYRLGPFSFTVVYHEALGMCVVPLPAGTSCSPGSPS